MSEFEAEQNPELDYFDHYMPSGRSKHDIGQYVQSAGITVPLINTFNDMRQAAAETGMYIRSDGADEYDGPSGLRHSFRLMPVRDFNHHDATYTFIEIEKESVDAPFGASRTYAEIELMRVGCDELLFKLPYGRSSGLSDFEIRQQERVLTEQFFSGSRYPGESFGATPDNSSLWRHVEGDNISIMRDPVQPDLYHFKWGEYTSTKIYRDQYEEGYPIFKYGNGYAKNLQRRIDSGDRFINDAGFGVWDERAKRYGQDANELLIPELWAPIHDAIDMYESVRTLPLFDQRQAPVMEMQYSTREKELYFLQYLKTGRILQNLEAFPLPAGGAAVYGDDVVGATAPEGDMMRIYLGIGRNNIDSALRTIDGEGVMIPYDLILEGGGALQALALQSRMAMIAWQLTFHNHHFGSAMFTRTPLSVGLMDWRGELSKRMEPLHYHFTNTHDDGALGYINAKVTSNGREVAVESDWQTHVAEEGR